MPDLFQDQAADWDQQPVPAQISAGVLQAMRARLQLSPAQVLLDFGAGTGLIAGGLAPLVAQVHAVDISASMLERLAAKDELVGRVQVHCQDLMEQPLGLQVDVVVSAMAMHHVQDTAALLSALVDHLRPGGQLAIADLDAEDGTFHPPGMEGVFHHGFDRGQIRALLQQVGLRDIAFDTAVVVHKEGRAWPIFLVTARR